MNYALCMPLDYHSNLDKINGRGKAELIEIVPCNKKYNDKCEIDDDNYK